MANVWKKIQRVGKHAGKFQFIISLHELTLECIKGTWKPNKLAISVCHRNRRYSSQLHDWEPTIQNPFRGKVIWTSTEKLEFVTTLFKDSRATEFEDKEWTIILEDVEPLGKRRPLASVTVYLNWYAKLEPSQTHVTERLKPNNKKVMEATLSLSYASTLLKEGKATDEDMQSLASLMSLQQQYLGDIGNMADFDDESPAGTLNRRSTSQKISELASSYGFYSDDDRRPSNGGTLDISRENSPGSLDVSQLTPQRPGSLQLDSKTSPGTPLSVNTSFRRGKTSHLHEAIPEQTPDDRTESISQNSKTDTLSGASLNKVEKEILQWCKEVTKNSRGVRVTNLTSSFRNGLAFCAIIQHFHPELIDFDRLSPVNIKENNKLAFDTAASLGIPKLLDPDQMQYSKLDDPKQKLVIITYLHQLRTHFTGQNLQIDKMDKNSKGVTYTPIAENPPDSASKTSKKNRFFSFDKFSPPRSNSITMETPKTESAKIIEGQKSSSNSSISNQQNESSSTSNWNSKPLITRQQLNDPFQVVSDEEDSDLSPKREMEGKEPKRFEAQEDKALSPLSSGKSDSTSAVTNSESQESMSTPTNRSFESFGEKELSREEILRRRARELMEHAKTGSYPNSTVASPTSDHSPMNPMREKELRERARSILASVKIGSSPSSPSRIQVLPAPHITRSRSPTAIQFYQFKKLDEERTPVETSSVYRPTSGESFAKDSFKDAPHEPYSEPLKKPEAPKPVSSSRSESDLPPITGRKLAELYNGTGNRGSIPDEDLSSGDRSRQSLSLADIQEEIALLEGEQRSIDQRAAEVEGRLRRSMEPDASENEEDILQEWFALVNKRNAIVRRLDQLNNLEKEYDLEARYQKLHNELQEVMGLEDWQKTEAHRKREQMLMADLVEIVKKRDELVQQLDAQERAIEEDHEVAQKVIEKSKTLQPKPGETTGVFERGSTVLRSFRSMFGK